MLLSRQPGQAELRIRRLITFALGIGIVSNLVTDFAVYRGQFHQYGAWWAFPTIAGQVLAAAVLLSLPWFSRGRALQVAGLAFAVFGLLTVVLIVPAAGIGGLPDAAGAAWPLRVLTSYALAAMLTVTARFGWVYLATLTVAGFFARLLSSESANPRLALEDSVVNTTVTVLLAILVLAVVRAARELDRSAEEAIEAVRRDSAAEAKAIERRRIELLAHDEILHVLRVVGMGVRSATVTPARLASATMERLEALESETGFEPDDAPLAADEFLRRLRGLVTAIAPLASFEAADLGDLVLPADAATALLDASGESLRNSMVHAGDQDDSVGRTVRLEFSDGILTISIADDGRGFRPGDVPSRRLGVARSIVARMREVPGGRASIDSTPGKGTRVDLRWG
ncbi:MAG: ATP-binding protein [Pseudolysinimonas sp.]